MPLPLRLMTVPYHAGKRGFRMGAGPTALLATLRATLDRTHAVRHTDITIHESRDALSTVIDINFALAAELGHARAQRERGLVISGNCNVALAAAGTDPERPLAVVWFDAHADFNTPETTTSGFVDGMALAMLTGRCCSAELRALPRFSPIDESHVVLVGARDLDPAESDALAASRVARVTARDAPSALRRALDQIPRACTTAYVHVDVDALDPSEGRANTFAASDGLTVESLIECIDVITERFTWDVATISAYDPAADADQRVAEKIALIAQKLSAVGCRPSA